MRANDTPFSGFDRKGTAFLKGIAKNNSKAWLEAHRDIYDSALLAPLDGLLPEAAKGVIVC